jgi:lipopolysaccharide export system permease protein
LPRLLFFYLARRISLLVLLLEVGLCAPVVITQLFHYLPASAVRSGLLWPALMGTLPTAVFLALPMAVGVAVALEFSRMASEGMIAVLYSLRLSVVSVCAPAATVAIIAVLLGYWTSIFIAPENVGKMHDVINVIRNSLNHRLLEPTQFYTFDHDSRTLYFKRWKTQDIVEGMFIHQYNARKKEEEIITAQQTEFRRNDHGVLLVMNHGSFQSRPDGSDEVRTADFDQYVIQLDMQGTNGMPKRNWRGVFEMPGSEFISAWPGYDGDKIKLSGWMSEAAKRFGIPILALSHTLLAMALVLTLSNATGRNATTIGALIAIPAVHIGFLIGMENLARVDPYAMFLVAIAIAIEFVVAIALILRQQTRFFIKQNGRTKADLSDRVPA